MLKPKFIVLASWLFAFAAQSHAADVNSPCKANCVSVQHMESSLIYTWRAEDGSALKTFYVDLPQHAAPVSILTSERHRLHPNNIGSLAQSASAQIRPEFMTHVFENEAEWLVVSTLKIYDQKGMLVSVTQEKVKEQKTPIAQSISALP